MALLTHAAAALPVVWHASDPVDPGETAMLFGAGFGDKPQVLIGRLQDGPAGEPGAMAGSIAMTSVAPLEATDQCVKFVVPTRWQPGLFRVVMRAESGEGGTRILDQPALWWTQVDAPLPGSTGATLRLFGKCLRGPAPQIRLSGPKTVRLAATGDAWSARAALPAGLPPGRCFVRFHSGYGGAQGWSLPTSVDVAKPAGWPARVFDVRDFGADGTGAKDDTAAIEAALAKAGEAGGGVVRLPRGRFQVTAGLQIPQRTVLRGAGAALTCLCWPDTEKPPEALIRGTNSFAVEDLTIYASRHQHILAGDLGDRPDAGHVRLYRVRVRADAYRGHLTEAETDEHFRATRGIMGGDTVRLGGDGIVIAQCDFYGSGRALYLSRVRGGRVAGNRFYNGRHGWYCISGSDGLEFEDNQIIGADLMSTGGGLNCLDGSSYSQNVYYARNRLSLMHGWDREAMTSDAGGGLYYGPIAKAAGVTLTLPEAPKVSRDWAGAGVFVFSGKGWSQYRRVVAVDGAEVTLDRAWDVEPDDTSLVGITMLQRHYLLVGNEFSDAGIAVQFYGTSVEHIVADNRCARSGGYQAIGKPYGGYDKPPDKNPCHQPSWFCQFLDNTIGEGAIYRSGANNSIFSGDSVIGVFGWPLTRDWKWAYNVGAVVRGNRLDSNARIALGGSDNALPSVRDVVVEGNLIRHADVGLRADRAVAGVVVRRNRFDDVREPISGPGVLAIDAGQRAEAELCRYRVAARDCGLSDDPAHWPELAAALTRLRHAAPVAAQQRAAERDALAAFLAGVTAKQANLPAATAAGLLGLDLQVAGGSTLPGRLQAGGGGAATLTLQLTALRAAPEWQVGAELAVPAGWQAAAAPPVPLAEGKAALTLNVTLPPTAWGRCTLPVVLSFVLPQSTRHLRRNVSLGSGFVRDWMVVGPFANRTGQPLDLSLNPPEDGVDLAGEYDGAAGKVRWQPVRLGSDWLDLGNLYRTKEPGVAYAVACLNASEETAATLRLGSTGGLAVLLNGAYAWSQNTQRRAAADTDRAKLTLRAGDNVLMLKCSTTADPWRCAAELTDFHGTLAVLPPNAFAGRACFAPPPPRPAPAEGELKYAAGTAWKLVYADDFAAGLSPRWRPTVGQWEAKGGLLFAAGDHAFVAYAEPLKAPLRIEYDTRAPGDKGGDLSPFWLRDPGSYASGYLIGFGSNGNTSNKLLIDGTQVAAADRPLVQPGKWHHVIAQILANGRVQLIVDEQLSIDHAAPPTTEAMYAGLWTWGVDGVFGKVRIYGGP